MTVAELHAALQSGEISHVRAVLANDPKAIEQELDGTPLPFLAAHEASLPMLRFLVEYGLRINLNAVDAHGRDLLHYAAQSGDVEKCRYLVERGGMDPLRADLDSVTPFDLAQAGGHESLCRYFEQVIGASADKLYKNPIRRGMWPDPSIVRVGEDYYMVNSSFMYFPCIPISHSRDLVHWHVIGHAITNPEWAHLEGFPGGYGYWAPDISYADGRFYIAATLRLPDVGPVRRRQMVVTSANPEGPYSEPVFFEEDGIDPSLFHDDDGRHYMLLNRGARIFEIDAAATKKQSEPTLLYYGSQKRAPEGPHLLKHDGWYYLFQAEGGTGMGHRETVARSRTLMGVYEPSPYNPVIRQTDERAAIQRCGHAKPVSTPDGRWFFVYLCGRPLDGKWTLLGRETALDPFVWTADGWPALLHGHVSDVGILPLPAVPCEDEAEYMTPRPPVPGIITRDETGITLRGSAYPLWDTRCRSICVRRQTAFRFGFHAEWIVPEAADGEAGILCYYDERSFLSLGLCRRQDACQVVLCEQIGERNREVANWAVHGMPGMHMRFSVCADGLTRTLRWAIEQTHEQGERTLHDVTYLADEGVQGGKRFTGAMVGVYALGLTARFEHIRYEEE